MSPLPNNRKPHQDKSGKRRTCAPPQPPQPPGARTHLHLRIEDGAKSPFIVSLLQVHIFLPALWKLSLALSLFFFAAGMTPGFVMGGHSWPAAGGRGSPSLFWCFSLVSVLPVGLAAAHVGGIWWCWPPFEVWWHPSGQFAPEFQRHPSREVPGGSLRHPRSQLPSLDQPTPQSGVISVCQSLSHFSAHRQGLFWLSRPGGGFQLPRLSPPIPRWSIGPSHGFLHTGTLEGCFLLAQWQWAAWRSSCLVGRNHTTSNELRILVLGRALLLCCCLPLGLLL